MKPNLTLILGLVILVLIGVLFVGIIELKKEDQLKQATIDGLKKANKKEADSLTRNLKLTRDSLSIAFESIRISRKESIEARERSQKTIGNLRKIVFITHTDSSRTAELKTLYKSYTP